jgi:DNA-binding PadR family transcriptional regulator
MSGSEIMDQVFEYTDYKPSPGSIYPLLSKLQELGLVEQSLDEDPSLKRYKLTEAGLKELNIMNQDNCFRKRQKTIRKMYWRLNLGLPKDLYEKFSALLGAFEKHYHVALNNKEKKTRLIKILDNAKHDIETLEEETS